MKGEAGQKQRLIKPERRYVCLPEAYVCIERWLSDVCL